MTRPLLLAAALLAASALPRSALGEAPLVPVPVPPAAASGASGAIDPDAATAAYLGLLSPEQRARSDAYFEGGYWLQLWTFLWSAAVWILLLRTGASARMRERAERLTRRRALRTLAYWVQFAAVMAVAGLPLELYRDHFREHRYGLSNQALGAFLADWAKAQALSLVLLGLLVTALYAVVRRVPRTWWLWATGVGLAFLAFAVLVTPVAIVPLFNHPTPLADRRVAGPVLALARANGVDAREVWEVDASRQTNRISANVSGMLGTLRITLNDNLLRRCSLPEIEAVMAHEIGHYVLNHVYELLLELGLVMAAGFAVVAAAFERLRARNAHWGVRDVGDPAGLPLALLLLSTYLFLATPLTNGIVRSNEIEADLFGLNAARQPDGFAFAALKLGDYRKLAPGRLEELLFFDHPSGRSRIHAAMRWKAEHPETWAAALPAPRGSPASAHGTAGAPDRAAAR